MQKKFHEFVTVKAWLMGKKMMTNEAGKRDVPLLLVLRFPMLCLLALSSKHIHKQNQIKKQNQG